MISHERRCERYGKMFLSEQTRDCKGENWQVDLFWRCPDCRKKPEPELNPMQGRSPNEPRSGSSIVHAVRHGGRR